MTQVPDARENHKLRDALQQLNVNVPGHDLPSSAEVWSRLQFRLAYRARKSHSSDIPTLLVSLFVLAFLLSIDWSGWLSVELLVIVLTAAAVALLLLLRASHSFRN